MKKTVIVSSLVILSTLIIFSFRLELVFPVGIATQEEGPFYLALVPVQEHASSANSEREILNITRKLYEAQILRDGHKAKAVVVEYADHKRQTGLLLSANTYQSAQADLKKLSPIELHIIPKQKMLSASIPRVNILSLYVGIYKTLPALKNHLNDNRLKYTYHLEIYDKRIRYLLPLDTGI